jgi:hypothetical protein
MLVGITTLASLTVLVLSIWPGVLTDLVLLAAIFAVVWLPALLIALSVIAVVLYRANRRGLTGRVSFAELMAIPALVLTTMALLLFNVPSRIAFSASRTRFEAMVNNAPGSRYHGGPLNSRLGLYWVDEYAADSRGGVFFRVHSGADGIGPDTMSYGFAKNPNVEGTPFGAAHYHLVHLLDDWYLFRASNDY